MFEPMLNLANLEEKKESLISFRFVVIPEIKI